MKDCDAAMKDGSDAAPQDRRFAGVSLSTRGLNSAVGKPPPDNRKSLSTKGLNSAVGKPPPGIRKSLSTKELNSAVGKPPPDLRPSLATNGLQSAVLKPPSREPLGRDSGARKTQDTTR